MNVKRWSLLLLTVTFLLLALSALTTAVIDPYFHYHAPLEGLQYPLDDQRYQNDGIVRHFDYTALITGTSMTENFKTSEYDALFGGRAVKACYSGGAFGELFSNLERAVASNPELDTVIFAIDQWHLMGGRDLIEADGEYPTYLYDDDLLNDIEYLLNKETLFRDALGVLDHTRKGGLTTSFDDFGSWEAAYAPYSAEKVLTTYDRPELSPETPYTAQQLDQMVATLEETLVAMARENPQIRFICYYPPYSILLMDSFRQQGTLRGQMEAFRLASQTLLEAENIHVYSFYDDYDTITDLNNYRDVVHHSAAVNSLLLQRFHSGKHRLTKETNAAHWQEVLEYYLTYDYEALF